MVVQAEDPSNGMLFVQYTMMRTLEVWHGVGTHARAGALLGALPWLSVMSIVVASGGFAESGIVSVPSAILLGGGAFAGARIGSKRQRGRWVAIAIPSAPKLDVIEQVRAEFVTRLRAR